MTAIVTSATGDLIVMVGEEVDGAGAISGITAAYSLPGDEGTFTEIFSTAGVGALAISCAAPPSDNDKIIFYGMLDDAGSVQIRRWNITADTLDNISPSGLGTKRVSALVIDPLNSDNMFCTVDEDEDLLVTTSGGTSWSSANAALGLAPTALLALFSTEFFNEVFIAGNSGGVTVQFSQDAGATFTSLETPDLATAANVVNLEVRL